MQNSPKFLGIRCDCLHYFLFFFLLLFNCLAQHPCLHRSPQPAAMVVLSSANAIDNSALSANPTKSLCFPYILRTFHDNLPLPKVLVFDLDYTLWPFWVDTHVDPPIKAIPGDLTTVKDRHGEPLTFYPAVGAILSAAHEKGTKIAAASRTSSPDLARQMLSLLHIADADGTGAAKPAKSLFDDLQIFPANKTAHMDRIKRKLGIEFEDMLFFDDEWRNGNVERDRGVCFWLVRDGLTVEEVDRGVEKWRKMRKVG